LTFQPPIVEVEKLVALGGAGLRGMQLQLLEGLDDGVEASRARRMEGGGSPRQPSLRGDEEI
jgi:hypothetical protein